MAVAGPARGLARLFLRCIATAADSSRERRHRSLACRLIAMCRGFNVAVVTARPVSCPKMKGPPVTLVTPAEIAVGHSSPMSDDLRQTPEDYKQLAERCMELASECSEPTVAEALRALAVDYLTRSAKLSRRGPIESLAPTTRRPSQAPRPAGRPRSEREGASAL